LQKTCSNWVRSACPLRISSEEGSALNTFSFWLLTLIAVMKKQRLRYWTAYKASARTRSSQKTCSNWVRLACSLRISSEEGSTE
jgi:hypothetical protein